MLLSKTLLRRHTVLPGFDLALGLTLLYLCLIVLIPLSAAFLRTTELTWPQFVDTVTSPRVVASAWSVSVVLASDNTPSTYQSQP